MTPRALRSPFAVVVGALVLLGSLTGCSDDDVAEPVATTTTSAAPTTTTTEVPLEGGETLYVHVPETGQCFDRRRLEPAQGGDEIVLLLDCDLPHQFQVFAVHELVTAELPPATTTTTASTLPDPATTTTTTRPSSTSVPATTTTRRDEAAAVATSTTTTIPDIATIPWPGDDALITTAKRICPARFEAFVGVAYEVSELEVGWILPTPSSWANGDRTVGCTLYLPDDQRLVGSRQAPAP